MAFAVYENFEKGYGLFYNNKRRPLPNVILTVAVTWRPPPNSISAVALSHHRSVIWQWPVGYHLYGHRQNGIRQWPPSGIVLFFVQNLLLISSIVCCLLSMLQPRLIVYIVNKDFCRLNKLVTYLVSLEQAVDGGYFTDIPPNVVGLKNSFLVALLSTFVFMNFFILFHKYKQISLIGILCVTASGKQQQEISY